MQAAKYGGNGNKAEMETNTDNGQAGEDNVQGTPAAHELLRSLLTPQGLQQAGALAQDCFGALEIGLLAGRQRGQQGLHASYERYVLLAAKGLHTALFEGSGLAGIESLNGIAQFTHALLHCLRDADAVCVGLLHNDARLLEIEQATGNATDNEQKQAVEGKRAKIFAAQALIAEAEIM